MKRLTTLNLIGVVVLVVLCGLQWRANRNLNLEVNRLERERLQQEAKLQELEKKAQGQASDLERFRGQLSQSAEALKDVETRLDRSLRTVQQLTAERDQLRLAVDEWSAAVQLRDARLKEANDRLTDLGQRLAEAARKYNELVAEHNTVVRKLNELAAERARTTDASRSGATEAFASPP